MPGGLLVNPATGKLYVYSAATDGGHIAYDDLKQSVKNMRMLRDGAQVMPMVGLGAKPFQTRFGLKSRPHFAIIDWRSPGGGNALPPAPPPLHLPPSAAARPRVRTGSGTARRACLERRDAAASRRAWARKGPRHQRTPEGHTA